MSIGFKSDTDTIEKTDEFVHEPGDHERHSHYLKKEYHDAYITGEEVEALCGHRWVPTKDPKRFPVCPECKEIFEGLPDE